MLVACARQSAWSAEFTLLVWNVESDFPGFGDPHEGNAPAVIADELEELVSDVDVGRIWLAD